MTLLYALVISVIAHHIMFFPNVNRFATCDSLQILSRQRNTALAMRAPVVVVGASEPSGALRLLVDQHRHSGEVRHITGSYQRMEDLRRAGISRASTVIILTPHERGAATDAQAAPASRDAASVACVHAAKFANPRVRAIVHTCHAAAAEHVQLASGWRNDIDQYVSFTLPFEYRCLTPCVVLLDSVMMARADHCDCIQPTGIHARCNVPYPSMQEHTSWVAGNDDARPQCARTGIVYVVCEHVDRRRSTPPAWGTAATSRVVAAPQAYRFVAERNLCASTAAADSTRRV